MGRLLHMNTRTIKYLCLYCLTIRTEYSFNQYRTLNLCLHIRHCTTTQLVRCTYDDTTIALRTTAFSLLCEHVITLFLPQYLKNIISCTSTLLLAQIFVVNITAPRPSLRPWPPSPASRPTGRAARPSPRPCRSAPPAARPTRRSPAGAGAAPRTGRRRRGSRRRR